MLEALLRPRRVVHAHCDLPCGDLRPGAGPHRGRVGEGDPTGTSTQEFKPTTTVDFRIRALAIKEARADLVKDHLWVLWTDYFKPEHLEKYPQLHELFWNATKEAGLAKKAQDPAQGQKLLDSIDEIGKIFWETKS